MFGKREIYLLAAEGRVSGEIAARVLARLDEGLTIEEAVAPVKSFFAREHIAVAIIALGFAPAVKA